MKEYTIRSHNDHEGEHTGFYDVWKGDKIVLFERSEEECEQFLMDETIKQLPAI